MPGEIVLDKKTFEALAMDSRVKILKALKEHQKTQSQIATELGLAVSTVAEHVDKLEKAGLVHRKEGKNKWVYLELTWKGERVISNEPNKGVFVLALVLVFGTIIAAGFWLYQNSFDQQQADFGAPGEGISLNANNVFVPNNNQDPKTGTGGATAGASINQTTIYCANQNGTVENRETSSGNYTVCKFANGTECQLTVVNDSVRCG